MKLRRSHLIISLGLILFVVIVAGVSFFFYRRRQERLYQFQNLEAYATQEAESLKVEVGEFVMLPDELPTIATVTDPSLLQDEVFFQKAQSGDKVLLFTEAKKAYLYRPSEKRVIDFTILNIIPELDTSSTTAQSESLTLTILNGTKVRGLAGTYEQQLASDEARLVVQATGNTVSRQYSESVLIDITKKNPELVQELATKLNLKLEAFPSDEATPSSDVVIILGQDQEQ